MNRFRKPAILSIIIAMLIITQTACSSEPVSVARDNYYLDTTCNIAVYEMNGEEKMDEDAANAAIDKAYDLCAELDKTLSKTVDVSDVARINAAGCEWVEVSDHTIALLENGKNYGDDSEGMFDITIGALTGLWDFHAADPVVPDASDLEDAVQTVDYRNVEINGNKVRLTCDGTQIDLGGIAKGYIADRMAEVLEDNGVTSGIVNLGGNIVCIGGKPGEDGFTIGVEAPFSDRTEIVGSVVAKDKTFVTSGVYERMFEVNGKIYHHILDPKTGWSVETDLNAVTLIADKGHSMDCDAMSTICLMKGYDAARKYIESKDGIEAVFVLNDGTVESTSGANFSKK